MDDLLRRILFDAPGSQMVAFGAKGARDLAQFRFDVGRLSAHLSDHAYAGETVLLACSTDRYAFAVALMAAWAQGLSVALPPNMRPETLALIQQEAHARTMIHDMDFDGGVHIGAWVGEDAESTTGALEDAALRSIYAWSGDAVIATLFSSGTTSGTPTPAPKCTAQLLGEARMLADTLFSNGTRVVSTVHPGHIYGLLYSVLAPLMCEGAFIRETPFFPESVSAAVLEHGADVLVTVPTHLATLESIEPKAFASLTRILSSTAPLTRVLATRLFERFALEVTEILGSSETGGMATRRVPSEKAWTPLPRVDLWADEDGRLWVDSPYASPSLERPYRSAERVEFKGGAFRHLGRMDGVIKIGGRRISLADVAARVLEVDGVHDAALAVSDAAGLHGKRLHLAVVADHEDAHKIQEYLRQYFEASTLPRRIQFVEALPREANGKLQRARLNALFEKNNASKPDVLEIRWLESLSDDAPKNMQNARYKLEVPTSYQWFEGHFDGYPLMAAAVQLHDIIAPAAKRFLGQGHIAHIPRMKFSSTIKPGDRLEIRMKGTAAALRFSIWRADTCCTSGRLVWEMST